MITKGEFNLLGRFSILIWLMALTHLSSWYQDLENYRDAFQDGFAWIISFCIILVMIWAILPIFNSQTLNKTQGVKK